MPKKKAAQQRNAWGRPLLYAAGACAGASGLYIAWRWLATPDEAETVLPPLTVPQAVMQQSQWKEQARNYVVDHKDALQAHVRNTLNAMGATVSTDVRDTMCAENPRIWLIPEEQQGPDGRFAYSPDAFARAVQADARGKMSWDKESEGTPASPSNPYSATMRRIYEEQRKR